MKRRIMLVLRRWPAPGDLGDCDYYQNRGTCSGGASCAYIGEPCCHTDEPPEGWPSQRNLWGRIRVALWDWRAWDE